MSRRRRVLGGDGHRHSAEDVLTQWELAEYYDWISPRHEHVDIDPGLVARVARLQEGAA